MKKKLFVFAFFVIAIMLCVPSFATFQIDDFTIDAEVLPNGDMEVTETINYYTNEVVNGLKRDIKYQNPNNPRNSASNLILKDVLVDGISCEKTSYANKGDSGVYTYSNGGEITLYSPFVGGYKTVQYSYTLEGVAVKYEDTAELYWNFLGSEWDCYIGKLTINVDLPAAASNDTIWVYGHGSDNGTFSKNENHITLNVSSIPAYEAIDARILFSRDSIPEVSKIYGDNVLQNYINEEEGMSKQLEIKKLMFGLTVKQVGTYLTIAIIIIWVFIYIFFDKEVRVEKTHYFRELPFNLEPELLQYIYYGKIRSNSFYIAVLNLIKLGVYRLEKTVNEVGKETQNLIYNQNHTAKLKEHQNKMVKSINGFFEPGKNSIDLIKLSSKMSTSLGSGYRGYASALTTEKDSLFGRPAKAPKSLVVCCAIVLLSLIAFITLIATVVSSMIDEALMLPIFMTFISFFYSVAFTSAGNAKSVLGFLIFHSSFFFGAILGMMGAAGVGWLFIPYLLTFILIQYVIRIKKYPKEERQAVEYIKGLRRYIKHYSMLDEKEDVSSNLAIWEDYFIMAIALGLNKKVANYFYMFGQNQGTNLGYSIRNINSYSDFSYSMRTPFYNYSRGAYISHSSGGSSSSFGGSSHSGSSGGFSGGHSSGGGGGRRWRWKPFLKRFKTQIFLICVFCITKIF